jgi:chloramphenicol-sensitive protein RarD
MQLGGAVGAARREKTLGLAYGVLAYGQWGFFPIYLKAVKSVPVIEVLCHRILWSLVFLLLVSWRQARLGEIAAALRQRRVLAVLSASTLLIALNWGVYIFSVANNRMLESSLGYYINPLVNVLLGVELLHERLAPLVRVAVAIAVGGVVWLTVHLGHLPWISLTVALSFAFYGLLRKIAPVGALTGLTVETLLLGPFAGGHLAWLMMQHHAAFLSQSRTLDVLLLLAGPFTAIPLLCFAGAARRLPLSTMGFLQYLSPTLQFLLAVLAYGEPLQSAQVGAFGCIWMALALFAFHSVRRHEPAQAIDA